MKSTIEMMDVKLDPENGYFDYILAGVTLAVSRFALYERAIAGTLTQYIAEQQAQNKYLAEDGLLKDDDKARLMKAQEVAKKVSGKSPHDVRLLAVAECRPVFQIIERAQKKRSWDPRDFGQENLLTFSPEYADFKSVARLLISFSSEVDRADGKPLLATDRLIQALKLAELIGTSPALLAKLVERSIQVYVLNSIEKHLFRLSLPEVESLGTYAERALSEKTPLLVGLESELQSNLRTTEQVLALDNRYTSMDGFPMMEEIGKLPLVTRQVYLLRIRTKLAELFSPTLDALRKGAQDWVTYLDSYEEPSESDLP
ncbi:MAG: hypothetical protein ABL962_20915, partial [Fimbriimonadaceae bacterium]